MICSMCLFELAKYKMVLCMDVIQLNTGSFFKTLREYVILKKNSISSLKGTPAVVNKMFKLM